MPTERGRAFLIVLPAWCVLFAHGCGKGDAGGPTKQFEAVLADLRAGSLASAYARMMPPSYDRDLNEVLDGLRGLLTDEDVQALRSLADKVGKSLAPALRARKDSYPLLGVVADRVQDLPSLIGIEDREAFRRRNIRGFLELLDRGLLGPLSGTEEYRKRLDGTHVSLVEARGDWARLEFIGTGAAGGETREVVEVIRFEDAWIPAGWVVDWPEQVKSWRHMLVELARARERDPAAFREALKPVEAAVEDPAPLVDLLLSKLGSSGSGGAGP